MLCFLEPRPTAFISFFLARFVYLLEPPLEERPELCNLGARIVEVVDSREVDIFVLCTKSIALGCIPALCDIANITNITMLLNLLIVPRRLLCVLYSLQLA